MAGTLERQRKSFRPWRWLGLGSDPSDENAGTLSEEDRAAARALEEALASEPDTENDALRPTVTIEAAAQPVPLRAGSPAGPQGLRASKAQRSESLTTHAGAKPRQAAGEPGARALVPAKAPAVAAGARHHAHGKPFLWGPLPPGVRLQVEASPAAPARDTWGLDELAETVTSVSTRDELARAIVDFMSRHFKRVAVFAVRGGEASGWDGAGPDDFPDLVKKLALPMDKPSLFSGLLPSLSAHIGPAPDMPETYATYDLLGGDVPPAVLMVPVIIRERLVSILYADNDPEPLRWVDLAIWKRVGEMMAIAIEIIILKNKVRGAR